MKTLVNVCVAATVCVYCAAGQDAPQNPPAPSAPSSSSSSSSSAPASKSERRISGGLVLSVEGLSLIPGKTVTVNNSSEISTQYQTTGASERIGYGLNLEGRITQHFYLDVSGLLRRMGYQFTTTVATTTTSSLNGISFPVTTTTSTHEDTRTALIDVPVLLRYYGTPKRPTSPRWFLEAGGTWRIAEDVRSSTDTTDASGNVTCCTFTPTVPGHRSVIGASVGAGIKFTDEFGIHLTPEVRYTRFETPIFHNASTGMERNEVAAGISLTF